MGKKILDTTIADTGPTTTMDGTRETVPDNDQAKRTFSCDVGAGDTVLIEGKVDSAEATWKTLHTFTASGATQIFLLPLMRARRSVDGVAADSKVFVDADDRPFVLHTA